MDKTRSIIDLLQELTRIPSRAGVDSYQPIVDLTRNWLRGRGIACELLVDNQKMVGLYAIVAGAGAMSARGPIYMLNATLDTAEFGDESRWTDPPTSGCIHDGWIYGRGCADSKAGVSLFCHVLAEMAASTSGWCGTCVLLLDLEEHTGAFAGIRHYLQPSNGLPRPQGVFIGYPGNDRIVVGSRGFVRCVITLHGVAAHSGSSRGAGVNAIVRAANLVDRLSALRLPAVVTLDEQFPLPPNLTVTGIEGGGGFSMVPDTCRVLVDVRLTPIFGENAAKTIVQNVVEEVNRAETRAPETSVEWNQAWPAYHISEAHPMVGALRRAAIHEFKRDILTGVVGPSNIGNYLQTLHIPATAGFGVTYRAIHALNECVELASLDPVYRTYRTALRELFSAP
jgi:succinyl-diaminopimelate desuccinylase